MNILDRIAEPRVLQVDPPSPQKQGSLTPQRLEPSSLVSTQPCPLSLPDGSKRLGSRIPTTSEGLAQSSRIICHALITRTMTHLIHILLAFGLLLSPTANGLVQIAHTTSLVAAPQSDTVFITRKGGKYHRWGCRYLRSSCIPVNRKDAIANGYTACSVCGG